MNTLGSMDAALALTREHRMLPEGGTVLCAVSGGADSVCLLHWLNSLRTRYSFTLVAAHYNHNLRGPESARDEQFVRSFVSRCCPDVPLVVGSGDVAKEAARCKAGLEETAREMRYAFLRQTASQVYADVIATAHNANDNAETILLHLIRGSGLRGLTGISPRRGDLVRPLLTTPRSTIEEYLRIYGLPHVDDSSNADDRFARNRVRHQLIPLLNDMQPQFLAHMTQTAELLTQDEEYLTQQAIRSLPPFSPVPGGFCTDAAALAALPDTLAVRAARALLDRLTGDGGKCSAPHLRAMVALCRNDDPSARLSLPGGILARRVYDRLEVIAEDRPHSLSARPVPLPGSLSFSGGTVTAQRMVYDGSAQTPYCFYLSCSKVECGLTLRPRQTGDRLTRPGRPAATLKKIMIDEKIPRHLRAGVPVLDCGGRVAAVMGLGPDADFLPCAGEVCWKFSCIPNSPYKKKGSL